MTQPPLCYPHPAGHHLNRPPNSDIHPTLGLTGNWALDFMAPGGTPFLCPQDSTVLRLSGHDPALGEVPAGSSIFGWNIYLVTSGGVIYFATHLGDRTCKVGEFVKRGTLLGHVGHWPNDPSRSHTHLGVTHPQGKLPSVARIEAVAQAVMLPFPPAVTWPAVFDGIGAMFVRCDNDPDVQLAKIPGVTWVAVKVNGTDITDEATIAGWVSRVRASHPHLKIGTWIYNNGPPATDVIATHNVNVYPYDLMVYDIEVPYKSDEGGHYEWAAQLVTEHNLINKGIPAAVTSYGGYKTSIDFGSFAKAGWPIYAQVYDSFMPGDESTYWTSHVPPGPYPHAGIHQLTRSLKLMDGQAVYRPESIDP